MMNRADYLPPKVEMVGLDFETDIVKIMEHRHVETKFFHLNQQEDGTWHLESSISMLDYVGKLEGIYFDGLERHHRTYPAIWKGIGWITDIRKIIAFENNGKCEAFIHLDKDKDGWTLSSCNDVTGKEFNARLLTSLKFSWVRHATSEVK
jgi:hypothetical protein